MYAKTLPKRGLPIVDLVSRLETIETYETHYINVFNLIVVNCQNHDATPKGSKFIIYISFNATNTFNTLHSIILEMNKTPKIL